jgi:hypothetical protein
MRFLRRGGREALDERLRDRRQGKGEQHTGGPSSSPPASTLTVTMKGCILR